VLPGIIASVIAFVFIYLLVSNNLLSFIFVITEKSAGIHVLPEICQLKGALVSRLLVQRVAHISYILYDFHAFESF